MVKCNEYSVSIMVDCYHHKWDTEGCFVLSKMFVPIVICIVLKILVKSGVLCINMILCIQPKTTSISFNFRNGHQTQMGRGIVFFIYIYLFDLLDGYIYFTNALKRELSTEVDMSYATRVSEWKKEMKILVKW